MRCRRLRFALPAIGAIAIFVVGPGAAASAAAGSSILGRAGSHTAVAAMLHAATGYRYSQVTTEPVCGVASPGTASCDAAALVTSAGQLVRPRAAAISSATVRSRAVAPALVGGAGIGGRPPSTAVAEGAPAPYTPQFLQEAYDTGWLSATAGAGHTVAIVDAEGDPSAAADLNTFRAQFGLPTISGSACSPATIATHNSGGPCLVIANQNGQASPLPADGGDGWDIEQSLDLDAVSSMCPNCNILLIQTNSAYDTDLAAGDVQALTLGAKYVSDSFGGPGPANSGTYYTNAEDASGQAAGAETFVATGDNGAYVEDSYTQYGQTSPADVPFPASEPYMTAVGGTSVTPSSTARGVTESAWGGYDSGSATWFGAGSACSTQIGTQQAWQSTVVTGCVGRAASDLSADADPETGIYTYDSQSDQRGWAVYGGTSLAAPLTAAYVALTGINSTSTANGSGLLSAQWAYADAAQLNDITSGSNGTACTGSTAYNAAQICNAGTGWDGPTGVGSISGQVLSTGVGPSLTVPPAGGVDIAGAGYSVVQSASGTAATFDGGVYPNGSDTQVWWAYGSDAATDVGTNFATASTTPVDSVPTGTAPVSAPAQSVSGLTEGTVYYVAECASNNGGTDTICGNATELPVTLGPVPRGAPRLSYTTLAPSGVVSVIEPTWAPTATGGLATQWQESSDGVTWNDATSASLFTITAADADQYLRARVTATDGSGSTIAYSPALQLVPPTTGGGGSGGGGSGGSSGGTGGTSGSTGGSTSASGNTTGGTTAGSTAQAPRIMTAPRLAGLAKVGATVRVSAGSYANASGVTISFERCAHACVVVQNGEATRYRLRAADAGHFLVARVRLTGKAGLSAGGAASGLVGPVISQRTGSLRITRPRATLETGSHTALLNVTRTVIGSSFHVATHTYLLTLTRASGVRGRIGVTLCWRTASSLVACSTPVGLGGTGMFSASVKPGQSLLLIASH
jgi:hypothetical protein